MNGEKTYVFNEPSKGSGLDIAALLPGLMGGNGMDPNLVAALMNGNGKQNGWGDSWFMIIILLFFCGGFGGRGFGNTGNDIPAALAGDTGREMIMQAVNGNGQAISQLASTLNCSTQNIQNAICGLNNTLTQIGGQVGLTGQQIINEIGQCCCQTQNAILTQGYENRLADCQQTNTLVNAGTSNTQRIVDNSRFENDKVLAAIDSFKEEWRAKNYSDLLAENTRLQTEINLRNQNSNFSAMINSAVAPVNAQLAHVSREVDVIRSKELPTYSQPYIPGTPVASYAAPMCGYGCGYGYGYGQGETNV